MEDKEKTAGQQLRDALLNQRKNGWDLVDDSTEQAVTQY